MAARACPGFTTVMVPCHAHWQTAVWSNAGEPELATVAGGVQGAAVAGTHGAGVNTPEALVAVITAGLDGELHMPNDLMFTSGTKSLTAARSTAGTGAEAT